MSKVTLYSTFYNTTTSISSHLQVSNNIYGKTTTQTLDRDTQKEVNKYWQINLFSEI